MGPVSSTGTLAVPQHPGKEAQDSFLPSVFPAPSIPFLFGRGPHRFTFLPFLSLAPALTSAYLVKTQWQQDPVYLLLLQYFTDCLA